MKKKKKSRQYMALNHTMPIKKVMKRATLSQLTHYAIRLPLLLCKG